MKHAPMQRGWFVRMAWRDSRGSRTHLLLSMAALAVGIAALVALRSFGERLDDAIDQQTLTLLGADYSIRSLHPFSPAVEAFLEALPGDSVRETRFYSMIQFPRTGDTRLSHIRALDGPYPFYGEIRADPPEAAHLFLSDPQRVLIEETLMLQFGVEIGDPVQIGQQTFTVAGRLLNVSGETPATASFIGPRVYLSMTALPQTELLREGSLARFFAHFRWPDASARSIAELRQQHQTQMAELRLEMETAEERKALLGNALDNVYHYLNLGAMVALLLGGIGCAASIQLYARKKRNCVAVLRCLGTPARQAFSIYLTQVGVAALMGTLIGAGLGVALQWAIPWILADFLPVDIDSRWSPAAVGVSMLMGFGLSMAFTLLPLLSLRDIPPLSAVRDDLVPARHAARDPRYVVVLFFLVAALFGFATMHTERATHALLVTGAFMLVFALLTAVARALMALARWMLRRGWSFAWRQGIANIHRPHNQTNVLLLSLGLGTFLLCTLALTQQNLLRQFTAPADEGQPNLILFDVQPEQVPSVTEQLAGKNVDLVETTPIVTMRLTAVNGVRVGALRDDPNRDIPHWVLFREYRTTYRDELLDRDRLVQGRWKSPSSLTELIPISIEEALAGYLSIGLGDRLTFDLQGVQLHTVVRSIRRVDWREMRTNFFVIFPAGVLEDAPQYFAIVTRTPTAAEAARIQQTIIATYPNISAFDLRMIVESIDEILSKAAFVIRFMAMFSVLTGLLVLGSTVATSRYDRLEETRLMRVLGARRAQLNRIMSAEYVVLGLIATLAGLSLALIASWSMAHHLFQMPFRPALAPMLLIPAAITAATLLVGRLLTR